MKPHVDKPVEPIVLTNPTDQKKIYAGKCLHGTLKPLGGCLWPFLEPCHQKHRLQGMPSVRSTKVDQPMWVFIEWSMVGLLVCKYDNQAPHVGVSRIMVPQVDGPLWVVPNFDNPSVHRSLRLSNRKKCREPSALRSRYAEAASPGQSPPGG